MIPLLVATSGNLTALEVSASARTRSSLSQEWNSGGRMFLNAKRNREINSDDSLGLALGAGVGTAPGVTLGLYLVLS